MLAGIRWGGLRTKIIAWSFVPTAIILLAVALVAFVAYQRVTEDLVIQRDRELIRLSASQLASELTEYTELLTAIARTLGSYEGNPVPLRAELQQVRDRLVVFDGGVVIFNTFGEVVAAQPARPEILGQDWSDHAYFRQMLRALEPTYSDIVPDGPGGAEVVVVAVPITSDRGEFLGTIAAMFRLDATAVSTFYGRIIKLRLGQGGRVYLVDGQGRLIYHTDANRIGADYAGQAVVQRVLAGQVDALRGRDLEGRDIVAGFAPVPGTPWGLVTEESWETLVRSGQSYRRFLLLLLALGVLVPSLVVAVGVRRITRPITELIGAARAVAEGDFGQSITAATGDEIEQLARQFNRMSAELQVSYAHLERMVAERTREMATLSAIAAVVSRSLDLNVILNDALDKALQVMEIESGGIYLLDEEAGVLNVAAQRGFSPEFVAAIDALQLGEGFSGRVVGTGEPLIVSDISKDPRLTRDAARMEGLRSLASVPLHVKGKVLGALFAVTRGYREFTGQDVRLLTAIGHQIGIAIENARLFEAERWRRREATLLAEMARLTTSTLHLDEVLHLTAEYAVDVFSVDHCLICLYDEPGGTLRCAIETGFPAPVAGGLKETVLCPSERTLKTVLEDLQPLIIEDVTVDPYLSAGDIERLEIQSILLVPIETGGRRLGMMELGTQKPRRRRFTEDEGELALALANQAALAIEGARLFEAEQRRAEQFRVISEVGRQVTSLLAVDDLLVQMAALIQQAFNYHHVGIGLVEGDEVVYKAGAGALWDDPRFRFTPARLKVGEQGITGWVAGTGQPLLVPDVSQDPRYIAMQSSETRSELAVPIKTKGDVIGVLDIQSVQENAFDESDLAVLQSLAHQAAIAIENAHLYEQAQHVAALEERQRLARDLHDSVTQALYGVTLYARAAAGQLARDEVELAADHLRELQDTAQEALAEMRLLIHELRPPILEQEGLVAALQARLQAVEGRAGLKTSFKAEGVGRLPANIEEGLYRVAQEALNNTLKHAHAHSIVVDLQHLVAGETVALEIVDDGVGFDPAAVRALGGMGLAAMQERVVELGGQMSVKSEPGAGTRVRVEIVTGRTWER